MVALSKTNAKYHKYCRTNIYRILTMVMNAQINRRDNDDDVDAPIRYIPSSSAFITFTFFFSFLNSFWDYIEVNIHYPQPFLE